MTGARIVSPTANGPVVIGVPTGEKRTPTILPNPPAEVDALCGFKVVNVLGMVGVGNFVLPLIFQTTVIQKSFGQGHADFLVGVMLAVTIIH